MKKLFYLFFILLSVFYGYAQKNDLGSLAKLKTASIFYFSQNFEWNELNKSTEFRIGILGADSLIKKELEVLLTAAR